MVSASLPALQSFHFVLLLPLLAPKPEYVAACETLLSICSSYGRGCVFFALPCNLLISCQPWLPPTLPVQ